MTETRDVIRSIVRPLPVVRFEVREVHEGDAFVYQYGEQPLLYHAPVMRPVPPPRTTYVYAVAYYADGTHQFEVEPAGPVVDEAVKVAVMKLAAVVPHVADHDAPAVLSSLRGGLDPGRAVFDREAALAAVGGVENLTPAGRVAAHIDEPPPNEVPTPFRPGPAALQPEAIAAMTEATLGTPVSEEELLDEQAMMAALAETHEAASASLELDPADPEWGDTSEVPVCGAGPDAYGGGLYCELAPDHRGYHRAAQTTWQ